MTPKLHNLPIGALRAYLAGYDAGDGLTRYPVECPWEHKANARFFELGWERALVERRKAASKKKPPPTCIGGEG